jgi:hypothetical protein
MRLMTCSLLRSQVDAVLAAAAESGITLKHLEAAESLDASLRGMYVSIALDALRITAPRDKLAFIAALNGLWQQYAEAAQ